MYIEIFITNKTIFCRQLQLYSIQTLKKVNSQSIFLIGIPVLPIRDNVGTMSYTVCIAILLDFNVCSTVTYFSVICGHLQAVCTEYKENTQTHMPHILIKIYGM
jgi:hypothetical protein